MTYSKELHKKLKALAEKATDLPWVNMQDDTFFGEIRSVGGEHFTEIARMPELDDRTNDFEYIVEACNSVPDLLDEIDRLRNQWVSVKTRLLEQDYLKRGKCITA